MGATGSPIRVRRRTRPSRNVALEKRSELFRPRRQFLPAGTLLSRVPPNTGYRL